MLGTEAVIQLSLKGLWDCLFPVLLLMSSPSSCSLQISLTVALLDIFLHASPRDQEPQNNHNPWHNAGVSE